MKRNRVVLSVVMIILFSIAWLSQLTSIAKDVANSKKYVQQANLCMEKGLYEKAINYFEKSLELKESKKIRSQWLESYEKAYEDGVILKTEYIQALESVCTAYPNVTTYWEKLLEFQLNNKDYSSAYKNYKKATNQGIKSKKIDGMKYEILYSFAITQKTYTKVFYSPMGYYTLCDDSFWGVMYPDGEWSFKCQYDYASPMNSELCAVFKNEKGTRLRDNDGVVQEIIEQDFIQCRAYGEEMLPIQQEDLSWKYLNCQSGELSKERYDEASTFLNGCAVVKKSNSWEIIGRDYKKNNDKKFDDIKLYDSGDYQYKNVILASQQNKYSLYDENFKKITNFECNDIDVYLGDCIAFKNKDGKWGFVNKDGKVVIEPKFEEAKSFSNGLAAVCKEGKWGYINQKGQVVIDYQFLDAYYFTEKGVAFVSSSEGFYYMIKLRFN